MSKHRKAYGYCRVSLDKMGDDSLEMQRCIVAAVCLAEGFELVEVFSDVVSGSVPLAQREHGSALLRAVKHGDIIVSLKLDRCFRDTADATATLGDLQRRKIGLYLKDLGGDVSASSVSALVFSLLASVATFERSRIAERTAESARHRKAQGRHMRGPRVAFGYRKVDRRDPGASEPKWYLEPIASIHDNAKRMKAEGLSLRAAAEAFRAMGHAVSHVGVRSLFAQI
jgi:DNA invertase Pin-like site-specific DNA recombinase